MNRPDLDIEQSTFTIKLFMSSTPVHKGIAMSVVNNQVGVPKSSHLLVSMAREEGLNLVQKWLKENQVARKPSGLFKSFDKKSLRISVESLGFILIRHVPYCLGRQRFMIGFHPSEVLKKKGTLTLHLA